MNPASYPFVLAVGVLSFVNSAPVDEKLLRPGSVERLDTSDHPVDLFSEPRIVDFTRFFVKARDHGYCLRRLSTLAPGTPSGFKGWKRKYSSGYVVAADQLYLLFRCHDNDAVRRAYRMRRDAHATPPPPRPCVNDACALNNDPPPGEQEQQEEQSDESDESDEEVETQE